MTDDEIKTLKALAVSIIPFYSGVDTAKLANGVMELLAERQQLQQQLQARRSTCPCTIVEPCSENCTCSNPVLSGGCSRCATYGSVEQKLALAKRLAGQEEENRRLREALNRAPLPSSSGAVFEKFGHPGQWMGEYIEWWLLRQKALVDKINA